MNASNHIVGGVVLTGVVGGFIGLNVLETASYLFVVVVGSLLPDIDHTKSLIGKVFRPISKWINQHYGHRTITHSLPFWLFITGFSYLLLWDKKLMIMFSIGYLTHLFLDMVTVQGVPLLYPFMKNSFVMPGNKDYRFNTGNKKHESIAFVSFILCGLWLQPLMETGFWTQYNRAFGTTKHLVSEYHKTSDLLAVEWSIKEGIEQKKGYGYCVSASKNKVVLIDTFGEFKILNNNKDDVFIQSVIPSHTGRSLDFDIVRLRNVSVDSLNDLLFDKYIMELDLFSNNEIQYRGYDYKKLKLECVKDFFVSETLEFVDSDDVVFSFKSNSRIETLRRRSDKLTRKALEMERLNESKLAELAELKALFKKENDYYRKEQLRQDILNFKLVESKRDYDFEIAQLELEIADLRNEDDIRKQTEYKEYLRLRRLENQKSKPLNTVISGFVRLVEIGD